MIPLLILGCFLAYTIIRVLVYFYRYEANRVWRKRIKQGDICFFISNNKKNYATVIDDDPLRNSMFGEDDVIIHSLNERGDIKYFAIPRDNLYVI